MAVKLLKPRTKRLVFTASVLFSFLIVGQPFLLKSTEIHRSPLPSNAMADLSRRIHSNPPSFPCGLHAVFLCSDRFLGFPAASTAGNISVSVTVDSVGGCSSSSNVASPWRCGAVTTADLVRGDEVFDELLLLALGGGGADGMRVYTVVVVDSDDVEGLRIVIGKHRRAWVSVSITGKIFVKYFMNGGIEEGEAGILKGKFMPVGSDGNVVLSFSLLNADSSDWVYDWEFEKISERMLIPVIEALRPIANINIESQVLYHTPKSSYSYSDDKLGANAQSICALTSRYIPSARECPLYLQLPDGELSKTNAFISSVNVGMCYLEPTWPPGCSKTLGALNKISSQELMETIEIFIGQLRQLFGLISSYHAQSMDGVTKFITNPKGFAQWELDLLYRHHACSMFQPFVQSVPRMIVMDEIGRKDIVLHRSDLFIYLPLYPVDYEVLKKHSTVMIYSIIWEYLASAFYMISAFASLYTVIFCGCGV
ncbi:hypothetical protein ABZP36_025328 [Zizania latifolia]